MVTSPKRYLPEQWKNAYPDTQKCCMCLCFPAGNDGNNVIHLRHDGPVHLTYHSGWFSLWTCGEILPGITSTPTQKPVPGSLDHCVIVLSFFLFVFFLEDGSEQRRNGDDWWVHRNLPKGKVMVKPAWHPGPFPDFTSVLYSTQDENIMSSMQLFENVI